MNAHIGRIVALVLQAVKGEIFWSPATVTAIDGLTAEILMLRTDVDSSKFRTKYDEGVCGWSSKCPAQSAGGSGVGNNVEWLNS